ncbi:C40 family peptidase [Numidum massiliense]|uniref:C40 family peptidase n=1 Tax=Numidum massiliense TaxID=1522315 RepID=UPI0006D575FC|nr:peptidoglycan-binding protein [Numidum massiliense]
MSRFQTFMKRLLALTLGVALFAVPLNSYAALGDQTLREGMSHKDVKQLQDKLKKKGYFKYKKSTGYFGPITTKAVKDFQRAHKVKASGVVDKRTFRALGVKKGKAVTSKASGSSKKAKTLRQGMSGKKVKDLQSKLKRLGYFKTNVTGYYGPITKNAVKAFQKKHKLKANGIAGSKTIAKINKAAKAKKAKKKPAKKTTKKSAKKPAKKVKTLRIGSTGKAVTDLQKKLKKLGYFKVGVTGYYGTVTQKAVKDFQWAYGMKVTGVAGPQTIKKVNDAVKGKVKPVKKKKKSKKAPKKKKGLNTKKLVKEAKRHLGTPYRWGGTSPGGFDCSGFLLYVYKKQGVHLPRTTQAMWNKGKRVSKKKQGDVVFFHSTYSAPGATHAGIYIGGNLFIHSASSGVEISNVYGPYWGSHYMGTKKLH